MQAMQTTFALISNAFKKHYSTPTNNNQRISSNTHNKLIAQPPRNMNQGWQMQMVAANAGNQGNRQTQNARNHIVGYNVGQNGNWIIGNPQGNIATLVVGDFGNEHNVTQIWCYNCRGLGHYARNCTNKTRVRDSTYYIERLMLVQQEQAGIPFTAASSNMDTAPIYDTNEISVPVLAVKLQKVFNLDEESSSDTPKNCLARECFNKVKAQLEIFQRIIKSKMTLTAKNWNLTVHLEVRKALETYIVPIVTHIDARIIHFEQEFVKEATEFSRGYKSLEKEANESLE
ncbi:integrase, catalytic region, zinc finger, CCHC-type containing protein [Tanacetum coccineum]